MPKTIPAPNAIPDLTTPEPRADQPPRPERTHTGPLSWVLGGAPQPVAPRSGPDKQGQRREQAPGRQPASADVRRRRNPSSRFRG